MGRSRQQSHKKAPCCVSRQPYYLNDLQKPNMAKPLSPTPAISAPAQPSKERQVTIMPAMNTPIKIDRKACLNFKPKRTAVSEPVQTPVAGRGIATNNAKPIRSYFSTTLPCLLVRSKIQCNIRSTKPILLSSLDVILRNKRRKGTGNRLPMIANTKA